MTANNDTFLPEGYEAPNAQNNYMRFVAGENRFRILGKPLIGWEWWVSENGEVREPNVKPQKGDKPVRVARDGKIPVEAAETVKHFWAMPVWNYKQEKIQILEMTQKTVIRTVTALLKDKEWGSPLGYDLVVTKTGERLETEYEVIPAPHKPIDPAILEQLKKMNIKLEALLEGGDPFGGQQADAAEDDEAIDDLTS